MRICFIAFLLLMALHIPPCRGESADLGLALVTLEFDVDENGKAQNIQILKTTPNAATSQDKEWSVFMLREHVFGPKYRKQKMTASVGVTIHANGSRTGVYIWTPDYYFPPDMLSGDYQGWFSEHLAAMMEPKLAPLAADKNVFILRVLYLPTFRHPVAVRIEKKGDSITSRIVVLSGAGGYEPSVIKAEKPDKMSAADFAQLLDEMEKAGFWKLPSTDDVMGLDGSELIIETVRDGKYAVFVRWTPDAEAEKRGLTKLNEVVLRLLEKAKALEK